jgi:phage terminase Nu1 subunit (DNA packaging protein)
MTDHIELAADPEPKPGDMGEHHLRHVRALLEWMMRDRVINCQCRTCAIRRIMLSLPERIAKRIGMTLSPRDIDAINEEIARVISEIAESDLKYADDILF